MDVIHASEEGGELILHGYGGTTDQQSAATPRRGSIIRLLRGNVDVERRGGSVLRLRMVLEVEFVV